MRPHDPNLAVLDSDTPLFVPELHHPQPANALGQPDNSATWVVVDTEGELAPAASAEPPDADAEYLKD